MTNQHIVIVGTTASGKSSVSVELAKDLDREIISLDSMQIYKGMEIGTGVITEIERKNIEHHMIGIIEPEVEYSVSDFQSGVSNILEKDPNKRFVFAGGTGLYTHAIIDDYSFAPTDDSVRKSIEARFDIDENSPDEVSVAHAYLYLSGVDPEAAQKIDPINVRRIIRALEVIELTGEKFSDVGEGIQSFSEPALDVQIIGLRYTRENLRSRIAVRVNEMFDNGWIEEVKALKLRWEQLAPNAKAAIGYSNIASWIDDGEYAESLNEVKEMIINKTSQFSRRQRKWFERDPRITWIDCDDKSEDSILDELKNSK